jgi:delta1-piperideine-2-carboxylate reductase
MEHRIGYPELAARLEPILHRAGASRAVARTLAENCAACERDGSKSHGIFRMPGYVSTLKSGWVDGAAVPVVEDAAPSFLRVDARNGFAQSGGRRPMARSWWRFADRTISARSGPISNPLPNAG